VYLLDTDIVSLIAPTQRRSKGDQAVAEWIVKRSPDLWLSVITAAEIEDGISNAARVGATRKSHVLREWWGELNHYYSDRFLPLDLETAKLTGQFMTIARAAGINPGFEDIAIAATAQKNDLIVLTTNEKDFRPLGIRYRNPFDKLPV